MSESLRWLVANGKKSAVLRVLKRAAQANGKDVNAVLETLRHCQRQDAAITPPPHGAARDSDNNDVASNYCNTLFIVYC